MLTEVEVWKPVHDFPDYSVSSIGRVRNERTGRVMAQTVNQQGIPMVGFSRHGKYYKRAVAPLVAHAFIPRKLGPFDTPINLDGDRLNNGVDNLEWRPHWFAILYHKQFRRPYQHRIVRPIMEMRTRETFPTSFEAAIRFGLLEREVVVSILNRTAAWPTFHEFRIIEE